MEKRCNLCPRSCNAVRGKEGFCRMPEQPVVARAALHFWEEPCISGEKGSGTVFFSGCNLRCVFCQNHQISQEGFGKQVSVEQLRAIYWKLIDQGAENINLVTPTHFLGAVAASLRPKLPVPVVYNCGGYEKTESLKRLEGLVDIYLPDLKYLDGASAARYSLAPDYPQIAIKAIEEMYRQVGDCQMNQKGMLQKGVLVRHLVLPGSLENSRAVLDWMEDFAKDKDVLFSLMSQYTPVTDLSAYPEINCGLLQSEYDQLLAELEQKENIAGFVQELSSAEEQYIPSFRLEGLEEI
ncbi:radical SAM protein [Christensenellaceae bacterium 44-20]